MKNLHKLTALSLMLLLAGSTLLTAPALAQETVPGTITESMKQRASQSAQLRSALPQQVDALTPFYTESGLISVSIDAVGTNDASGTVQVDKPSGATVRDAFLLAASVPGGILEDGDVTLEGNAISWDEEVTFSLFSTGESGRADVASIVQPIVDAAPAGPVDLLVAEPGGANGIDGEILVVVFDDPNQTETQTISLSFGAQDPGGDTFFISLADPFDGMDQNITMSLGISFGFQGGGDIQDSQISVNGERLTSAAGGNDDGEDENGALITVGGLGDDVANPPDPFQRDNNDARYDDELYTLDSFIENGDTQIDVGTQNPSNDDNIFFAAFVVSGNTAIVGEDILLTPTEATSPVGTDHTLTATVQDNAGDPVTDTNVDFEVTSGPNAGLTGSATTDADGEAQFTYSSTDAGTDVIVASFVNSEEETIESNEATKEWTEEDGGDTAPPICGGFAEEEFGTFFATATDSPDDDPDNSGVASILLASDAENLFLDLTGTEGTDEDFADPGELVTIDPPQSEVEFEVLLDDPGMAGSGTVTVTDAAGNQCTQEIDLPAVSDEDDTPPVCGNITIERDAQGVGTGVVSSVTDEESGIDEITFTRLANLEGFYDTGAGRTGGFGEGQSADLDESAVFSLEFGGARLDFDNPRATLVVDVTNGAGMTARCDPVIETITSEVPERFTLKGNYPNPFSQQTTIEFQVAEAMPVTIEVYDMLGRKVATLVDEEMAASTYRLSWDGRSESGALLSSGVYVYRIEAGQYQASRKLTLIR